MAERTDKKLSPIELQKSLKGSKYPASRDALVQRAQENSASSEILDRLRGLPADSFETPASVMKALGRDA